MRYLPGTEEASLLGHLRGLLAEVEAASPGIRLSLEVLSSQRPTQVELDHPMVEAIEKRTEQVTGRRPFRSGQSGATVAKFLIFRGIPAVGFSCGPDEIEHQANEWIALDDVAQFAEVMTLVCLDLLTKGEVR